MPHIAVLLDPDDPVVSAAADPSDRARARLERELGWASVWRRPALADPLADLLLDRVLDHQGPFGAAAERYGPEGMSRSLLEAARADLRALHSLAERSARPHEPSGRLAEPRAEIKRQIAGGDWGDGVVALAAFFHAYGAGVLGRHRVFRWDDGLVGVDSPDPIVEDELIGYETERAPLRANLQAFVSGLPANNALLYGDRGTGKSSTVKALAAAFPLGQLRLLEVSRAQLWQFPQIGDRLRHRPARFLVLVDDLSFDQADEHEGQYAALKSMLEGGVQSQPSNMLLYATSNRRHLVRENLADRRHPGPAPDSAEVHVSDSFQQKLSLSDRFGLRVLFLSPDQDLYLDICRSLVRSRGLEASEAELERAALLWCRRHNARSCRTARQFVDDLQARLSS